MTPLVKDVVAGVLVLGAYVAALVVEDHIATAAVQESRDANGHVWINADPPEVDWFARVSLIGGPRCE